jgi:hypothetical protein
VKGSSTDLPRILNPSAFISCICYQRLTHLTQLGNVHFGQHKKAMMLAPALNILSTSQSFTKITV